MIWTTVALAQSVTPYAGTWTLDASASDGLDAVMKAQGVSWPLRKLAATARPELQVEVIDGTALHIITVDTLGGREDVVRPDSVWRTSPSRLGDVSCATDWLGTGLRTTCRLQTGSLVLVRKVADDVWTQDLTFTPTNSAAITATRVFRR